MSDQIDLGAEKAEVLRELALSAHSNSNAYIIAYCSGDGEVELVKFEGSPCDRVEHMEDELGLNLLPGGDRWAYIYRSHRTQAWDVMGSDTEMKEAVRKAISSKKR